YAAIGAGIAVLMICLWAGWGRHVWRQRLRNAFANELVREKAPVAGDFAVYLRAFKYPVYVGVDLDLGQHLRALILRRRSNPDRRDSAQPLELVLAKMLDRELPLVGLGRPYIGFRTAGAGLVDAADAEWQAVVTGLLDRCSLIVMVPAGTAGTAWELEQLAQR